MIHRKSLTQQIQSAKKLKEREREKGERKKQNKTISNKPTQLQIECVEQNTRSFFCVFDFNVPHQRICKGWQFILFLSPLSSSSSSSSIVFFFGWRGAGWLVGWLVGWLILRKVSIYVLVTIFDFWIFQHFPSVAGLKVIKIYLNVNYFSIINVVNNSVLTTIVCVVGRCVLFCFLRGGWKGFGRKGGLLLLLAVVAVRMNIILIHLHLFGIVFPWL